MSIEQLERVLYFFYDDRKWYKKFEETYHHFEQEGFTRPELLAILQKLTKDGYITEEKIIVTTTNPPMLTHPQPSVKEKTEVSGWYMSYDGVFLIDTLPRKYTGRPYQYLRDIETKKKKLAARESFPKVYWWAVVLATAFLTFVVTKLSGPKKTPQQTIKTVINEATHDTMKQEQK